MRSRASVRIPQPSHENLERIRRVLRDVGGNNVSWGAQQMLDVLVTEHRMRLEWEASERLKRATWTLAFLTAGLLLATVALVIATLAT